MLLVISIALSLPSVQTKIAKYYTEEFNKKLGINISIDKIALTIFGTVKLKSLLIKDHHKDTLLSVKQLNTNFIDLYNLDQWKRGDLIFGDIRLIDFYLNLKNYKDEKYTNLDKFIEVFDNGEPSSGKFLMTADAIYIEKGKFLLTDENRKDPKDLDLKNLDARLTNFIIKGSNVDFNIEKLKFKDHRGIDLKDLQSKFSYTKTNIILGNLTAKTKHSDINGSIKMSYDRKDFADFNNKVIWDFNIENSKIGSNDVFCFYNKIGKDKTFLVKTKMKGTLNNFWLKNLSFQDENLSNIKGDLHFINSFGNDNQRFKLDSNFETLETSYEHLISLLPKLLENKLPKELKKLERFNLKGSAIVTANDLIAKIKLDSKLGLLETDINIKDVYNSENAIYNGKIITENFDIGNFIEQKNLGKISTNINIDGRGFTMEKLNTNFKGTISKIDYNNYKYTNIEVDGFAKKPLFIGKFLSNDPNLKMQFDGKIDFSKKENVYQFESDITIANLKKINFIKDSTAVFKGKIISNITGNSIDNMHGTVNIMNAEFQKNNKTFNINDIVIRSNFDENRERTLFIDAKNIVEGEITGKYSFAQIPKMVQNALGSIYTNYKEHNLGENAYMKFNFLVNNQLLELFYPGVSIDKPSRIRGNINTQNNEFKLFCNANLINVDKNKFFNLKLELDNKNPVYNTYITLDSIQNKKYTISDFNLLNITEKDTMYFRSEFKGGKKKNDFYNLDFYHTIDEKSQNIIGFNKSEINIKNYSWYINEQKDIKNRIIIDKSFNNFYFEDISFSHEKEKAELKGSLIGTKNKDLKLIMENLNINKLIPFEIGPEIEGNLTGNINLYETEKLFEPKADIVLSNFKMNKNDLGELKVDVKSDKNLNILDVKLALENKNIETLFGKGTLDISTKKPQIDFDLSVNKLDISFLNKFSESIISNIRGLASGTISIQKDFDQPEINGRLYLNKAGLKIDYTEVDYNIADESIIDVTQNLFNFRKIELNDKKYQTKGILNGYMKHKGFEDWFLDFDIKSDYINIFDKKENDDSPFYGRAFIKGTSSIKGPMNAIVLNVNAYSEKGTVIKIPITNSTNSQENSFISYLTAEEKYKKSVEKLKLVDEFYGLEMIFDLYINNNAEIEVILDKETGHAMKGKGVGLLGIEINTLGKFKMEGDIILNEGDYVFSYQNIIRKDFKIKKDGTIRWDGNPFSAILDVKAVFNNVYANPSVLLENSTTDGRKYQVEVGIDLIGQLDNLNPEFTINFPTLNPILTSEVNTKLTDKDTRTTQALSLLATGSFISQNSNFAQNFITNNFYETLGNFVGNLVNEKNGNITIVPDIVISDNNPNAQAGGNVGIKGNIKLSDRVSINGKVGIPTGDNVNNTLLGNVELLYRINEDGTLNFRAFNRENDINFIGEGIGYTQGLGLTYQFDFNNFAEFKRKFFGSKKKKSDANNDLDNEYNPNKVATDPKDEKIKNDEKPIEQPPEL